MHKNKLIFINIVIIVILLIVISGLIINKNKKNIANVKDNNIEHQEQIQENNQIETNNTNSNTNKVIEVTEEEKQLISELKNQTGITGDDDLYVVGEEYDGRKTLVINPQIEFNVVLAGILKQDEPQISEVENILKDMPKSTGIWVSEQSRADFLELIGSQTNAKYYIDSEGYLKTEKSENQNEYDEILYDIINGDNLVIINISGFCYCLDEVTGEVVSYQFEDMDPYQPYEVYELSNSIIYVITSNKEKLLSNKDILDELLKNNI